MQERQKQLLPHLYAFNLYEWQRRFIECFDHTSPYFTPYRQSWMNAANQIGKSVCNVIKMNKMSTEIEKWAKWWPGWKPTQFWYLLPDYPTIEREVEDKWIPTILPSQELKDHPRWGWKLHKRNGKIWKLEWNTGLSVYLLSYSQQASARQASTLGAVFIDEEPPFEIMGEIAMRTAAAGAHGGYISGVMTPTTGQEEWRRVFEEVGKDKEIYKNSFKQTVTLYDCMQFEDGTPSHWTEERIEDVISKLGSQAEIDLRTKGAFVAQEGLVYEGFNAGENVKPVEQIPPDWMYVSGIDIGSGGKQHASGIIILAIAPDFSRARVIRAWKGTPDNVLSWRSRHNKPGGPETSTGDILEIYTSIKRELQPRGWFGEFYDWASKDFQILAERAGLSVQKAEKGVDLGQGIINTVFKYNVLSIDETPENHDLVVELNTLRHGKTKTHSGSFDDLVDALRYAVTKIPFPMERIKDVNQPVSKPPQRRRLGRHDGDEQENFLDEFEEDIQFWQGQY